MIHRDGLSTDRGLSAILSELQLTAEQVIERNETFLLLKCADQKNRAVVIKYSHSPELRQGRARINNEAALVKNLKPQKPLRFLKYYADGQNFLVTEFEEGELLLPNSNYGEALRKSVADALIKFQLLSIVPAAIGVKQRTGRRMFYIKGIIKHVLHLWPNYISLYDSFRCLWIVVSSLPVLGKPRVICHGDLLPTNLIYKAAEEEIVFTDLEGFLPENHPLYDVLSFCTIDVGSIWEWNWQKRFLRYYLERTKEVFHFDSNAADFRKVLRALLVFLLAYRLNESRINLEGTTYFDGLAPLKYVLRKVRLILATAVFSVSAGSPHEKLETRKKNLEAVLSKNLFTQHVTWLLDVHRDDG
jgi:thiamine kinase-like enzyme